MEQFITMVVTVVVSLLASAVVFVGANRAVDQAVPRWPVFTAVAGSLLGLVVGSAAQHNGWVPAGPALAGPLKEGWLVIVAGAAVGAAVGALAGRLLQPARNRRITWEGRLRPWVFAGPALAFVTIGLIIPGLRTVFLSFKNGTRGREPGYTLEHYRDIFTDDNYFTFDGWAQIFTSRLFIAGLAAVLVAAFAAWASATRIIGTARQIAAAGRLMKVLGVVGVVLAAAPLAAFVESLVRSPNRSVIMDVLTVVVSSRVTLWILVALAAGALLYWTLRRVRSQELELDWGSPSSSMMIVLGAVLLIFGALSTLQAVVWNNIWWVVTVAGLSTALGLLLAVLADHAYGDRYAKTLIFMPMAISMVGAAVIWDFMFEVQATGNQTGLVNAILQGLGFNVRGFFVNASMIPWNNFWIMIIMVWIQTGFAMVVLSAAIRAVPDELLEAARVDGASETQAFWRVVMPQIRPTVIVVVTTLIVIVTKVFDLVKATTGGANRTNVLANEMFDQLRDRNFTSSSAFAVVLLALVVPVMIFNIRRLQKDLA
ncbi:MAG: sugar ABC transporter permease [Acidimicrobiaceae bacterium]|nr:sugar ABC transporter permease [Acidimicrobiaceae bacterium]MCY4176769.1 sugar ABC transporter permease [Acidimicrobiaceae bacterium]MCY4280961.1 sugar ABC transporter permease [Acidimicrobiaceae bacterium]MCY4295157.1 sugar ABC transporter permease [Acidimicrobiaceae bacterium]